jgi:hypothetical protein
VRGAASRLAGLPAQYLAGSLPWAWQLAKVAPRGTFAAIERPESVHRLYGWGRYGFAGNRVTQYGVSGVTGVPNRAFTA